MLKLEIVTPERKVFGDEVDSVTVPTVSGEIGLLPNHAPLISALKPGVLSYSVRGQVERMVVSSGFVELSGNTVSVMADVAESANEIDAAEARSEQDAAEKALAAAGQLSVEETEAERTRLEHSQARVQLVSGR